MKYGRIKLHTGKNTWFLVFLLFPIIMPSENALIIWFGEEWGSNLGTIFKMWIVASVTVTIAITYKKEKLERHCIWIILFCSVLAFSTFMQNNANIASLVRTLGPILLIFLLANTYKSWGFLYYVRAVYYWLTIISLLTAITIYLYYPQGMYTVNSYLYGLDNVSFIYAFSGFAMGFLYEIVNSKKLSFTFLATYSFIGFAYIYVRAGIGIVVIMLCAILCLFYQRNIVKKVDYRLTLIFVVVANIFFLIIRNFNFFTVILNLLDKDIGLNGRVQIWKVGLLIIKNHWLFGVGMMDSVSNKYIYSILNWTNRGIGHLHNMVLEILLRGGILAFSIFIILWLGCYKKMQENKGHIVTSLNCIFIALFTITCMFEFRMTTYTIWFLLIASYHITGLIDIYERD